MLEGTAGFWSYVHADDDGDQGRIVSLAEHLKSQYQLATGGEELDLFVDRDIRWGEEWEARIGDVIAGTTFFVPIVTPSYFNSQACRDELLKFVREAERLGLRQLVMPIYWRTVPSLEDHPEESPDEAVRIIGRYQRKDFRQARLEDEHLSVFRKAVDDLAGELARRTAETETVRDVPSSPVGVSAGVVLAEDDSGDDHDGGEHSDEEAELGIMERLAVGEDALPAILEVMQEVTEQLEEINRVSEVASNAYSKVQNAKAGLIITEQFAHDLAGPAGRIQKLGSAYASKLAELDAAVEAQLELVAAGEGPLGSEPRSGLESVIGLGPAAQKLAEQLEELVDVATPLTKMSRSLRVPIRQLRTGLQGIVDGRTTIDEWGRRAAEVLEHRDTPDAIEDGD